ncbi:MAG: hypothetical protein KJ077_10820 [Anaerolineae bacterium]|nr:hypothetical protein [Anaerolineae bacterium]
MNHPLRRIDPLKQLDESLRTLFWLTKLIGDLHQCSLEDAAAEACRLLDYTPASAKIIILALSGDKIGLTAYVEGLMAEGPILSDPKGVV